jgi:uncharacterized protein
MDEILKLSLLLDFYGQMLTARQFEMMDQHCNNDLSLGEIAEQLKISRQAVHDGISKAKNSLLQYEEKLGLLSKFISQQKTVLNVIDLLNNVKCEKLESEDKNKLYKAIECLNNISKSI